MIRAAIFDLDGTILDSFRLRIQSWIKAFSDFGITVTPEEIFPMIGLPGVDLAGKFSKRAFEIEEAEERYFRAHLPDLTYFPDVSRSFKEIEAMGIRICIVTSSRRSFIDVMKIDHPPVITIDDVQVGKPDPKPYLLALKKIGGIGGTETIVFGDAVSDMIPAREIGAVAVLVRHGRPIEYEGCDYYIDEIAEAVALIKHLRKQESHDMEKN